MPRTTVTRSSSAPARTRRARAARQQRADHHKSLTLKGAGADRSRSSRSRPAAIRSPRTHPDIRDGKGDILAAVGKAAPITVNISGVTVDANGVDATAGVVFVDAQGSIDRSRVTGAGHRRERRRLHDAGRLPQQPVRERHRRRSRARTPTRAGAQTPVTRTLTIDHTRVDSYNAIGVLVDGATSDYSPATSTPRRRTPSGVVNQAILTNDQIAGRNSCQNYNDPTAGGPTVIDGDCQASGGSDRRSRRRCR